MLDQFSRTQLIYGQAAIARLHQCRVAVFGVGGVGGYAMEALVRSGIGAIDIVDDDKVCLTNLNRQIIATHSSIGRLKVEVARERALDINPACNVTTHACFFLPETAAQFDFSQYDYVIDAVDTVTAKLALIEQAAAAGTPIISCMGAGNKVDPTKFQVADIYETKNDRLARVIRKECRKRGIKELKVEVARERALDINPTCNVTTHACFFLPETAAQFDFSQYDYVIDAVDTVTAKLALIEQAAAAGTPIISCMGAGNKVDPTKFQVADIYETKNDRLARVIRKECRKRGIKELKVVYSTEPARRLKEDMAASCKTGCVCPPGTQRTCLVKNQIPGSTPFVPSVAGLICAATVVNDLTCAYM
jgi:tRNA A37 threonylcarbamoyladenosine dehydratase